MKLPGLPPDVDVDDDILDTDPLDENDEDPEEEDEEDDLIDEDEDDDEDPAYPKDNL